MSFKNIIEPAFKSGNILAHVIECAIDFKPFLSHLEKFKTFEKNLMSDFISVLNAEAGARHTFHIDDFGEDGLCRDIYSSKLGYYGLPTTALKKGVYVETFNSTLNAVKNDLGFLFSAHSENVNILYASSNDIKSRVVVRQDGSVDISFRDTFIFDESKIDQLRQLKKRQIKIDGDFVNVAFSLPDMNSMSQPKSVLQDLWNYIEKMGAPYYFDLLQQLTHNNWNEILIAAKLSDVVGVFTTSQKEEDILKSVALAGMVHDKLTIGQSSPQVLPIVYYHNGNLQEINITRDKITSDESRKALNKLDSLTKDSLTHYLNIYIKALEKQQELSR